MYDRQAVNAHLIGVVRRKRRMCSQASGAEKAVVHERIAALPAATHLMEKSECWTGTCSMMLHVHHLPNCQHHCSMSCDCRSTPFSQSEHVVPVPFVRACVVLSRSPGAAILPSQTSHLQIVRGQKHLPRPRSVRNKNARHRFDPDAGCGGGGRARKNSMVLWNFSVQHGTCGEVPRSLRTGEGT